MKIRGGRVEILEKRGGARRSRKSQKPHGSTPPTTSYRKPAYVAPAVARTYDIPKRRANELRKMAEESLAKKGYIFIKAKDSAARRMAQTIEHRVPIV